MSTQAFAPPPVLPLDFHATVDADSIRPSMPGSVAYLLPVSSWVRKWNRGPASDVVPSRPIPVPKLPPQVTRVAADCGGFVATARWGGYKFLSHQYVTWCDAIGSPLQWAAIPDFCCEPEIATSGAEIRERQDAGTAQVEYYRDTYLDCPWAWIPTLQGWEVGDYRRHARELRSLIGELQQHYWTWPDLAYDTWYSDHDDEPEPAALARIERASAQFRVGVGTLCRRASVEQIHAILAVITDELPGVPLHLWGVKLGTLTRPLPPAVISIDSAAWNGRFYSDVPRIKDEATTRGLSQREHGFTVALPRYLDKLAAAFSRQRPVMQPA